MNNSVDIDNWHWVHNNDKINTILCPSICAVWRILNRTPDGIQIADSYLPQQPTLSDMTQTDLNFALRIEQMFSHIAHPEYRQLMVEVRPVKVIIVPVKVFRTITHNTHIIARDVLYTHGMSTLRVV